MKQQSARLGLDIGEKFHLRYLSWREARHRSFLVVISLFAIADVSTLYIFQKERVKAIIHRKMRGKTRRVFQVDHRHERMERFQSKQLVVLLYLIQFNYIVHKDIFLDSCKYKGYFRNPDACAGRKRLPFPKKTERKTDSLGGNFGRSGQKFLILQEKFYL